jgi:hypothetical protein
MNKNLEKILNPVLNPIKKTAQAVGKTTFKYGLPLLLTLASVGSVAAQQDKNYYDIPPTYRSAGSFEIVRANDERTIHVDSDINLYVKNVSENVTYTLDVLTVKSLRNGKEYVLLNPSDDSWIKGDIINVTP